MQKLFLITRTDSLIEHPFVFPFVFVSVPFDMTFVCLQIFNGNDDRNSIKANWMRRPFVARYLRIYAKTWNSGICLRVDGYGSTLGKLLLFLKFCLFAET